MSALILVAEDDENQAELVRRYLEQDHHRVLVVHDGRDALDVVRAHGPALVVLDLMLPGLGGLDVCRALRAESDVLVLMLTARSTEDDLLHGLGLGADDYMTKPFSPRELVARVRTLLRRVPVARPEPVLQVGPIVVDQLRHEVRVRGEAVECTPGEFGLLEVLASEVDRVFSREQLLRRMHGLDSFLTARTIDTHVKNLRRKIETDPRAPAHLVTVYGIGYKLTAGRADAP
ncbi:response regulator transcription factor [Lentzea flaviverrucosa]|uniref:DNA-binding response regulator, OmpR family, contains REC and winged-helix (WHTH) domain n=1 Tax=Lentzea flaviverrucosa TaxID=200379 RepID=A0A1H9AD94_9PSEU|nr:response regulator transcription factor [Lentzea flaviverrucosa]RDI32094.1 DNA-binding response OmpR family regulator [Lentzea flaviverrucosa]SEP74706.1 DNA-binding response regulator, OmpR family, contains REC and winged-helix (wHTH) domain [Lentzea flaviverrucosa]